MEPIKYLKKILCQYNTKKGTNKTSFISCCLNRHGITEKQARSIASQSQKIFPFHPFNYFFRRKVDFFQYCIILYQI